MAAGWPTLVSDATVAERCIKKSQQVRTESNVSVVSRLVSAGPARCIVLSGSASDGPSLPRVAASVAARRASTRRLHPPCEERANRGGEPYADPRSRSFAELLVETEDYTPVNEGERTVPKYEGRLELTWTNNTRDGVEFEGVSTLCQSCIAE